MKLFDSLEKEIIKKIVKDESMECKVLNILDKYLTESSVNISINNNVVDLAFELNNDLDESEGITDIIEKRLPKIQLIVLKLINLINYLEKNGFLTTFLDSHVQNKVENFGECTSPNLVGYQFPDPNIADLFVSYVDKRLLYTPDLKELVENKFIYKDEVRYRQQLFYTRVGIIISIALGLYSVLSSQMSDDSQILNTHLEKLNNNSELLIEEQKVNQNLYIEKSSKIIEQLSDVKKIEDISRTSLSTIVDQNNIIQERTNTFNKRMNQKVDLLIKTKKPQ